MKELNRLVKKINSLDKARRNRIRFEVQDMGNGCVRVVRKYDNVEEMVLFTDCAGAGREVSRYLA